MDVLRTPDERFSALPDYDFEPHYVTIDTDGGPLVRMHYVDEGPRDAPVVLLLHGEPSWSYLYRTMIPPLVAAGLRVVAPDLIGFGRSDKPAATEDYTYARHVNWVRQFVLSLKVDRVHMVCQDWGGLIGLRLMAEQPERFDRVVAANTFLPTGKQPMPEAFLRWQQMSQSFEDPFPVGNVLQMGTVGELSDEVLAAYEAPFPDASYTAGARVFPALVPTSPDDPASEANQAAWKKLGAWERPFLTAFGDSDPITRGAAGVLQAHIPGASGQRHTTIEDAGHFLQEDQGEALAQVVVEFLT